MSDEHGTPAAARLENIARFIDFTSGSLTRAAEQAREVLFAGAEMTPDGPTATATGPGPGPGAGPGQPAPRPRGGVRRGQGPEGP